MYERSGRRWAPLAALLVVGLATAALAVGFGAARPAKAQGQAVTVDIQNFAFNPGTIQITAGTTVTWTNQDSAAHTVTADDGSFDSGQLAQGQSFSQTFDTAGTVAYHCEIHKSMTASVVVAEAAAAATDAATEAPTDAATAAPTEAATEGATEGATEAPTEAATEAPGVPTTAATAAPTKAATGGGVASATKTPAAALPGTGAGTTAPNRTEGTFLAAMLALAGAFVVLTGLALLRRRGA